MEHIQADPIPSFRMNIPPAPPSSPITPFPHASTQRTPPSPSTLDPSRSPPAPSSPQQQQPSVEPAEVPPSIQEETDQFMDRTKEEKKQTDSDKPKPAEINLQILLMQLEEPTHEEAFEEVKNFDYTKIILTLSRQFKCQQVVAKETDSQKERADRAYEEITNLRIALELVTQERDTNAKDNENLLRDLIDLQSQWTRKEAQNHELIKNEKKMKEQFKYKDARFQKITASYNTVKNTLTALLQNQEPASVVPSTSDSATTNTLAALQDELQTKELQRQLLVSGFISQTAQHEAKVKQLELELAQAKADLELQRQQSEILSKGKEAVGSLASTSQIHQAETHLHVQLPLMPEMLELTSTQEEEQQRPAPGALDVREQLEQEIEDMLEGPAKEYLLYKKKMAFPNFHGRRGENAGNFLDDLEMAFLVSGREDEEIKLRAFPLVLREEAKVWFEDLDMGKQGNWEALKRAFLLRYSSGDNNPEEIWRKLSKLQQASPDSYSEYETQFLELWTQWENSLPEGERAPNFLQKERLKDRKLQFQRSWRDHSQAASSVTTQEQVHPLLPNGSGDPYLDRLRRVTKQLDSLSINLINGLQPKQPVQQQAGGQGTNDKVPRRPPRREYQCHSYGEDEHGMYFCPYLRGYGNAPPRGPQQQISPPRMRPPPMSMCDQQQQQPIQILRQSTYAPVPQFTTEVPPLPHDGVERAMNVISCEDKGEEKIMEAEAMPGKQAIVAEEPRQMTTNDGANKKEKKRKKKANMTRRKIGIINFPVKSKPHDLIEEVQRQEPKLTWPQLLHLSPRMQRQWSKMVSTGRGKNVNTLKAQVLEDYVPVLDTQIKGQRVSSDYVDGGAQMCVISEKMMHKLRLEVRGPFGFEGNDVSVKYVGVVTVCGIHFGVDMYVLPARGEGYPIILGRPWLIAMNVRQDWESRTLLLKPPRKEGKSIQTIVYNVKEGRKESLELETSEDEWSTEDSSSTAEVTSTVSDSESEKSSLLEAMGVVLTRPTTQDGGSIKETLSDEKIEDMLSTDLSKEERKEFEVMLQKHSPVFILDYKHIKGVTVRIGKQKAGFITT
ncbi:hypothetical protein L7F22_058035 [Adiantum nelumboides]|nr:hypothetical protein [Adiantum nelumboides]